MTKDSKSKSGSGEMPFFDFTKLLEQYKLPGIDFAAVVDLERKNIEALAQANKIAFEGWQALVRRQSEILQETMTHAFGEVGKHDGKADQTDIAVRAFEKALENMRELAEMAVKSQKDAFEVIRKRVDENIERFETAAKK